jgi:hypothetical protein
MARSSNFSRLSFIAGDVGEDKKHSSHQCSVPVGHFELLRALDQKILWSGNGEPDFQEQHLFYATKAAAIELFRRSPNSRFPK